MLTHILVTPSPSNRYKRSYGSKHVAVYLISLPDYRIMYHRETLFIHGKGPLNQIFLCCLYHQSNQACNIVFHIISFLLTFPRQGLARNTVFTNLFFLWNLSCFNICHGFINVNEKVILPPLFHGRRGHHIEKWLVTQRAHYGTWLLFSCCQYAINYRFTLNNQSYWSIKEYCNIINLYYPSAMNFCMCHKMMFYVSVKKIVN